MEPTRAPNPPARPQQRSVIEPALKVGALTGSAGFVVGAVSGVIRNTPALLFATASGAQWFGLGTMYWAGRSTIFQAWDTPKKPITPNERASASAIAGGVTGASIALLTRGLRNVVPGGIMFSLFAFVGQSAVNMYDKSKRENPKTDNDQKWWQKLAAKKWSPVAILNDAEYETLLKDKILRLEAEIALVDDRITEQKAMVKQQAAEKQAMHAAESPK